MSSSLMVFILAMVLNPHIAKRAQEEIDSVVGRDRLPDFDDRLSLPYVEAIMRETMRWQPLVPLGKLPICTHIGPAISCPHVKRSKAFRDEQRCLQRILYT
jgi:cytochrome P450